MSVTRVQRGSAPVGRRWSLCSIRATAGGRCGQPSRYCHARSKGRDRGATGIRDTELSGLRSVLPMLCRRICHRTPTSKARCHTAMLRIERGKWYLVSRQTPETFIPSFGACPSSRRATPAATATQMERSMDNNSCALHLRCLPACVCMYGVARNSVPFTHHLQSKLAVLTESAVFACGMKLARGRVLRLSESRRHQSYGHWFCLCPLSSS